MDYLSDAVGAWSSVDIYESNWIYNLEYCKQLVDLVDMELYEEVSFHLRN